MNQIPKIQSRWRRASSTMEYVVLIIFILGALVAMREYIVRAMSGRWKAAGDTAGWGRQYDPRSFGESGEGGGTLVCRWEPEIGNWVDRRAAEQECDCTIPTEDAADYKLHCTDCLKKYATAFCNDGT